MRSACASALAVLLLGCTPQGSSQPPEPQPAIAGDPVAANDEPAADDATGTTEVDAPDPGPDSGPDPDPGTEPAGQPDPEEPAQTPDDPGTKTEPSPEPEPTPKPVVATLQLPKPKHSKVDAKCGRDPGVGQKLKSFSLPGIKSDKKVTNTSFRGRVQVVNFWGTWCKPCLKELPEFDALYRRYRKHGMTLLAIATDEDAEAVRDTVSKKKLGAKIAIAGEDYAGQYGSPKFPFTFVVDYKGVIRGSYRGYKPECMGKLEADIREQLQIRADAKAKSQRKKKGS
jgi:thiol-disulfide isomerase/thioredoxin